MANTKEKRRELRITGVSPLTCETLKNIAAHIGYTPNQLSVFLRPKLQEIIDSYPAHMKKPLPDY